MNIVKAELSEVNKAVRVLHGNSPRLKYTVRLHRANEVIEWQADERPKVAYVDSARSLWICASGYDGYPITPWTEGAILLTEENEKASS